MLNISPSPHPFPSSYTNLMPSFLTHKPHAQPMYQSQRIGYTDVQSDLVHLPGFVAPVSYHLQCGRNNQNKYEM